MIGLTDTFDRADGPPGTSDWGFPWTVWGGSGVIDNNRLKVVKSGTDGDVASLGDVNFGSPMCAAFEFETSGWPTDSFFLIGLAVVAFGSPAHNLVVNCAPSDPGATVLPFVVNGGTVYKMRVLYTNASPFDNVKMKVWKLSDPEPSGWMVDHTGDPADFPYNSTNIGFLNATVFPFWINNLDLRCSVPSPGGGGGGGGALKGHGRIGVTP